MQLYWVFFAFQCSRLFVLLSLGYDGENNLKSMECYDPKADRWEFHEPLTAHEGGVGVGLMPMKMYSDGNDDED